MLCTSQAVTKRQLLKRGLQLQASALFSHDDSMADLRINPGLILVSGSIRGIHGICLHMQVLFFFSSS